MQANFQILTRDSAWRFTIALHTVPNGRQYCAPETLTKKYDAPEEVLGGAAYILYLHPAISNILYEVIKKKSSTMQCINKKKNCLCLRCFILVQPCV